MAKGKREPLKARIIEHYEINNDNNCWEWHGGKNNVGYGMIRDGTRMRTAHRVSYELNVGPIPPKKHVLHICDNPKCVNPKHLRLGTHQDNMLDMKLKKRHGVMQRISCVHCGITSTKPLITRWHNDNCKHK